MAPVLDHPRTEDTARFAVNIAFMAIVFAFIVWAFGFTHPLRKGFGIAVSITVLQHLTVWYYGIRK